MDRLHREGPFQEGCSGNTRWKRLQGRRRPHEIGWREDNTVLGESQRLGAFGSGQFEVSATE
jgi:hypothetical protein